MRELRLAIVATKQGDGWHNGRDGNKLGHKNNSAKPQWPLKHSIPEHLRK